MRSLLFVSLATVVACQETEIQDTTDNQSSTEGTVEEGNQESEEAANDIQIQNDFAGGLDTHFDDITFFDQISDDESGSDDETGDGWGAAPMVEGPYIGTVELVYVNSCAAISEGELFHTTLEISEDGQSILGNGLLESNGDVLRLNRLRERTVDGTVDCIQTEAIDATGTMFSAEEMELEIHTSMYMTGTDCPVVDPCSDGYLAYFELESNNN